MKTKKIATVIKEHLEKNGIKQEYLANKANIASNTLSDILNGKRRLLADEFIEIVTVLNVDANYFIDKVNNSDEQGG